MISVLTSDGVPSLGVCRDNPSCLCGACERCKRREYMRSWYQRKTPEERRQWVERRDKEKVRARDRERSKQPEVVRRLAANTKRWRSEHPDRARAQYRVAYALRTGKLVRQPCEVCGATNVHAHHDDYSKPLEVRWLCPLHHAQERRR